MTKKHHILLRAGQPDEKLNDRVFDHEIRRAIKLTDAAYGKMLYKEALKGSWLQYDKYFLQSTRIHEVQINAGAFRRTIAVVHLV